MFGKREPTKFDPSEFRIHDRRSVRGLKVYVDKEEVELLDYSDGGMRVSSTNPLPRVAVIEIYKGGKVIRTIAAVTAWARGGQTGYAFRPKLKITHVEGADERPLREAPKTMNETGGVSGSALRNRLKI